MTFIYSLGVSIFHIGIRIAAIFNGKARKWVKGRENLLEIIEDDVDSSQKHTWFHFASLGEFEQG